MPSRISVRGSWLVIDVGVGVAVALLSVEVVVVVMVVVVVVVVAGAMVSSVTAADVVTLSVGWLEVVIASVVEEIEGETDILGEGHLSESAPGAAFIDNGDEGGGLVAFDLDVCAAAEEAIVSARAFAICAATKAQSWCKEVGVAAGVIDVAGVVGTMLRGKMI